MTQPLPPPDPHVWGTIPDWLSAVASVCSLIVVAVLGYLEWRATTRLRRADAQRKLERGEALRALLANAVESAIGASSELLRCIKPLYDEDGSNPQRGPFERALGDYVATFEVAARRLEVLGSLDLDLPAVKVMLAEAELILAVPERVHALRLDRLEALVAERRERLESLLASVRTWPRL